jgi:hypothetical protein
VSREQVRAETEEWLRQQISRRLDKLTEGAFYGTTTSSTAEMPTLNAKDLWRQMANFRREWRRNDLTIVVLEGHEADAAMWKHPTEGTFVECGYHFAARLHERFPLVLLDVPEDGRAHFRVAHELDPFVPLRLPPPPYRKEEPEEPRP